MPFCDKNAKKCRNICVYQKKVVTSSRPFPFGVGSLRIYVRTFVQTTRFLANKITLKQA